MQYGEERDYLDIDEEMVKILGKIVKLTGAKVCLISTHRLDWMHGRDKLRKLSSKVLQYLFYKYNIEVIGITSGVTNGIDEYIYPGGRREDKIKEWLNRRDDVESFCVIDDDDFDLLTLQDYLVKTDFHKNELDSGGLRDRHIPQAVKILQKTNKITKK